MEVANKYYELTELDFEISCASEPTWEDFVLIKQLEIISQLLGFVPARQDFWRTSLSFVSCVVLDLHNSFSLCHGLSLEPLLNSCTVVVCLPIVFLEIFTQVLFDGMPEHFENCSNPLGI